MNTIKIIEENFKAIEPSLLLEPGRYQEVEDMVVSIDAAAAPDYAKRYFLLLAEKLEGVGDKMPRELLVKYLRLIKALRLYSLLTSSDGSKEQFFREQVLDALGLDFVDAKYWTEFIFRAYFSSPDLIESLRKTFLRGLESNIQVLGRENLRIPGEEGLLRPMVRNWITDYNRSAPLSPVKNSRGRLEEQNYLNQSENARRLEAGQRGVLANLLALYDFLRFAPLKYDFSLPGQKPLGDAPFKLDQTKHDLVPQELLELVNREKPAVRVSVTPPPSIPVKPPSQKPVPAPKPVQRVLPPPPRPQRPELRTDLSPPRRTTLPRPGEGKKEEDLYRSTLEELAKTRTEYEKKPQAPPVPIPPRKKPLTPSPGLRPPSPARGEGQTEYKPFSVNEAIIRGAIPEENHGEIVPGEKDIEEKLKKLEDKLK